MLAFLVKVNSVNRQHVKGRGDLLVAAHKKM